jgi:predicted NAD/FAD-dependent oxidoreductase
MRANVTFLTSAFAASCLLQTLVSVSTIGTQPDLSEQQLVDAVKQELSAWFGAQQVSTWNHLRTYRIPFAQPNQKTPTNFSRPVSLGSGLYVCGDHRDSATFDAALKSGRRAAEALLQEQGGAGASAASGSRTAVQASA